MEQQLVKVAAAIIVETDNLAIDHSIARTGAVSDLHAKLGEALEHDAPSRNELTLMANDVR